MNAQSALAAQRRNKSVKRLMNALLLSAAFVAAYGGFASMSCEAKGSPDACIGGGGDCLDIQGLIDGAAAKGGGMVVVPAGLARDFTFKGKKAEAVFRAFAKEQR